ncbi:MAG: polymer-forming cytoskeletal protein [Candidatus Aerophobetes bacterium]
MFRRKEEFETESVIGKEAQLKGTLKDKESSHIDGKVEGKIQVGGDVIVGEDAIIKADIQAKSITIRGKVVGNVDCQEKGRTFSLRESERERKGFRPNHSRRGFFDGKCKMIPSEGKIPAHD